MAYKVRSSRLNKYGPSLYSISTKYLSKLLRVSRLNNCVDLSKVGNTGCALELTKSVKRLGYIYRCAISDQIEIFNFRLIWPKKRHRPYTAAGIRPLELYNLGCDFLSLKTVSVSCIMMNRRKPNESMQHAVQKLSVNRHVINNLILIVHKIYVVTNQTNAD